MVKKLEKIGENIRFLKSSMITMRKKCLGEALKKCSVAGIMYDPEREYGNKLDHKDLVDNLKQVCT